jgi:hypothetical protein
MQITWSFDNPDRTAVFFTKNHRDDEPVRTVYCMVNRHGYVLSSGVIADTDLTSEVLVCDQPAEQTLSCLSDRWRTAQQIDLGQGMSMMLFGPATRSALITPDDLLICLQCASSWMQTCKPEPWRPWNRRPAAQAGKRKVML